MCCCTLSEERRTCQSCNLKPFPAHLVTHEDAVEEEDEDEERPGSMLDVLAVQFEKEESAELVLSFRKRFGLFASAEGTFNVRRSNDAILFKPRYVLLYMRRGTTCSGLHSMPCMVILS